MDINYLLFLQNFRNTTGQWLGPIMDVVSKLAISMWPFLMVCMVYWVLDRKNGKRILAGLGAGVLANGLLKLSFCVYRPWIRDARVIPYGDSITTATGYSFPSGHSTKATALYGGTGWLIRKRHKIIAGILFFMVGLTMFSRNFLGVHTPQDVIIGFASTVLMMFLVSKLEDWSDKDIRRDKIIMIAGLLLSVALVIYYIVKPYPLTYLEDGSLLVDPVALRADGFVGIGFISSYVVCRYFERRYFSFDQVMPDWKDRFIVAIPACFPLGWWLNNSVSLLTNLVNKPFGKFMLYAVPVFYVMIFVPWIMSKVHLPKRVTVEI